MNSSLPKWLDRFYWLRKRIVTAIVFLSLRFFGSEITWDHIWNENFVSSNHTNRNLDNAGDLTLILEEAKKSLQNAEARREGVTDKCKTLLTLSSLLLTLVGILLPKTTFDSIWLRLLFFASALALLNAVILLVAFFGVRTQMIIEIQQDEINLSSENLKKCLINLYFQCRTDLDNHTDYLVEVYKVARFFFLSAFAAIVFLFSLNFFFVSPESSAKAVARELETDTNFVQMVRGEKGQPGPKGDRGECVQTNILIVNQIFVGATNSSLAEHLTNSLPEARKSITP
jgi:hypothetical protein